MGDAGNIENTEELGKRVSAARAYAGNLSLTTFAERVGIGRQTLVRIENGTRESVKRMELREMATVAGLPMEFFTADFELLTAGDGATRIQRAIRDADRDARDRQDESPEEPGATENPSQ